MSDLVSRILLTPDGVALVVSYIYVTAMLLTGEVLGRFVLHGSTAFTRKFVHVSVGLWIIGTALLFTSWKPAIIPPLTFIVINYVAYRYQIFSSIQSSDRRNLGTVYFPLSFSIIVALFWAKPAVMVAGMMPMVVGDALAAVIGLKWGRHPYTAFGNHKSWEGSAAMFVSSFVAMAIVLLVTGSGVAAALAIALLTAAVATVLEAVTPAGLDNLTVPLVSALLLWLLV